MTDIKISTALNGWIVECKYDVDVSRVFVFSHSDSIKSEVEAFVEMLWQVNDFIGPSTSRYSPERVSISVKAGDNYECLSPSDQESEQ
jgi:hypothetical protein